MESAVSDAIASMGPVEYEKAFVRDVYDRIAFHFSDTRYKSWPKVKAFVDRGLQPEKTLESSISSNKPSDRLTWVDAGCGNGKNLPVHADRAVPRAFGFDTCHSLVKLAATRSGSSAQLLVADALHIPFRANVFEGGICIAVLHHITTAQRRVQLIRECARILTAGAHLLLYAWAHEQEKVRSAEKDVLVPWKLRKTNHRADGKGASGSAVGEFVGDERRFCHLYGKDEIEELIREECADVLRVEQSYYDRENWAVVCVKKGVDE